MDDLSRQWSLKQRVDLVYRNSFAANIATIAISLLFVLTVKNSLPSLQLWSWFILISLVASGRIYLALCYRNREPSSLIESWVNRYVISSILIGLIWGSVGYFYFVADEPALRALIFMLQIGIIASAMIVLSSLLIAFYGHIIPIFLGLSSAIIASGGSFSAYIFIGLLLYLAFISAAGKNTYKHITESLQYQYENQDLIGILQDEIHHREQAQNELEEHQENLEGLVEERTGQLKNTNELLAEEVNVRRHAEEELKHLAYHDELTQLPNRLLLIDRLEHALERAQRHQTFIAVLFIDLNGFKKINDTFGHATGDRVLNEVAERLKTTLREEDTISRFGGDEFVILIEDEGGHEIAKILSEKVAQIVSQPIFYNDENIEIGCSIGISLYPQDGSGVEELLGKADTAMYQAKNETYSCRQFYS